MSSENCPFKLSRPNGPDDDRSKDRFCMFEIPIDPNDPDGLKSATEVKKLNSDDPEDVLSHILNFDLLVANLGTAEGQPRFRLFEITLGATTATDWNTIREDHPGQGQQAFESCIYAFILSKMTRDVALDTKEWLNDIKKPRSWSVQNFLNRIKQINFLIQYMQIDGDSAIDEASGESKVSEVSED